MRYEIEWTDGYVRGSTGAAESDLERQVQWLFEEENAKSVTITEAKGY